MASYNKVRESDVEWLWRPFPEHWSTERTKDLGQLQSGTNITAEEIDEESAYPVFGGGGLRGRYGKFTNEGTHVLVGRQGALCGNITLAAGKFWATDHAVVVYHQERRTDVRWLAAILDVMNLNQYSLSAAQPGLSVERIKQLLVPVPPLPEQHAIAAYFDDRTAQIDHQVALLGQKAEHYRALKQALINRAVTRGLDPSVPMKDSGVEWIGEVPGHWEAVRIGSAFDERSEIVSDVDYPPLSVSMAGIVPQMESVAKTDNNDNRKRVCVGDFVINSRSDRRGASGISRYDGSVSVINIILSPRRAFFGPFLHLLFRSYRFTEEFYRQGRGIVDDLWTTRYSAMKTMEFFCPPLPEQQAIADYLDDRCGQIDAIVGAIDRRIATLKELRKALINEVVTGQRKVV